MFDGRFPEPLTNITPKIREKVRNEWQGPFGKGTTDTKSDESSFQFIYANCKSFNEAMKPKYKIIIGRRGSGKTALLKRIKLYSNYDIKIECKKQDLIAWMDRRIDPESNYLLIEPYQLECEKYFWKLVFQEVSNQIQAESKSIDIFLEKGKSFFEKIWFGIVSWAKQNQKSTSWIQGLASNLIVQFTENEDKKFARAKEEAKKYLEDRSVVILIDSLEEYTFETEHLQKIFSAILLAVGSFEDEGNFAVKCFFPSESYSNLTKYPGNWGKISRYITFLRWTEEELLVMLCKRLAFYLYCNRYLNIDTLSKFDDVGYSLTFWQNYFSSTVENTVFKVDEVSILYILRHTQMAPRQAIRLCNKISDCGHTYFPNAIIPKKIISQGVAVEEKGLCREVFGSFKDIYPNAEEFCDEYLSDLPMKLSLSELRSFHNRIFSNASPQNRKKYDIYSEFNFFQRMLCELGIFGKEHDDCSKHSTYCLAIFEPNEDHELSIGQDEYIYVHPMFIRKIRFRIDMQKCPKPICSVLLAREDSV